MQTRMSNCYALSYMGILNSLILKTPACRLLLAENKRLLDQNVLLREQLNGNEARLDENRKLIDTLSVKVFGRKMYCENPTPTLTTKEAIERTPITSRGRAIEGRFAAQKKLQELMDAVEGTQPA